MEKPKEKIGLKEMWKDKEGRRIISRIMIIILSGFFVIIGSYALETDLASGLKIMAAGFLLLGVIICDYLFEIINGLRNRDLLIDMKEIEGQMEKLQKLKELQTFLQDKANEGIKEEPVSETKH